ncbi:hypothetical protein POVWA2_042750 [Plasmodium ovale wallikeri]|uniref:Uncharacterized protein n=1 Tax=Plasmodium ovale wallikeri TaxID=864142 RepID=A0A1A8ZCC4_PLAOA|nr:hypothetical protein POVWA1_044140 [Plasmodium ovale wallikeri]SBT41956.1 hypothetical protein POVWA2_042750 [Plasmodium ovale wallikeri]
MCLSYGTYCSSFTSSYPLPVSQSPGRCTQTNRLAVGQAADQTGYRSDRLPIRHAADQTDEKANTDICK